MAKGSSFERQICKTLSLWWTDDRRDDVLWRSAGSGARGTQRHKAGQTLAGQYGDICATDPVASPITQLATWELKRGYSTKTFADCFDYVERNAQQGWERFFEQTIQAQTRARTPGWCLVSARNQSAITIFVNSDLISILRTAGAFARRPTPHISFRGQIRKKDKKSKLHISVEGMLFDDFLAGVTPAQWADAASG